MSRILPLRFDTYDVENEEIEGVCPRYIKWTKRVKAFDFSKRKNVTIERPMPVFDLKNRIEVNSNTNQKKSPSRTVLSQIRRGGINFKIRCKTSADLWRRWISAGDKDNKINEDEKKITENINYVETNDGKKDIISEKHENKDEKIEEKVDVQEIKENNQEKSDEKIDEKEAKEKIEEKCDEKQELIEPEVKTETSMPEVVANNE